MRTVTDRGVRRAAERDGAPPEQDGRVTTRMKGTRRGWSRFLGPISLTYIIILVAIAVTAPLIAPFDPNAQNLLETFQSPGTGDHILGTDGFGRDVLSRLIYGTRVSLIAAIIGVGVAVAIGVPTGIIAGYFSGKLEGVTTFLSDALMSIPGLILALTVITVLGPGLRNAMVAIGIVLSPLFYRLSRAETLSVRRESFVEASVAIGCSHPRTIGVHVFPNTLMPIVIQAAVAAGTCIVAEAALSYLGLGVLPPTASWGSMLSSAQADLYQGPYLVWFPGVAIALTVLAFSLLGDWLRHLLAIGSVHRSA